MKDGGQRYAVEKRYVQKGYFRKYSGGGPIWKASEASCCNCVQQGWKITQEEIEAFHESIREKKVSEAYQQGRQGISGTDQGRSGVKEISVNEGEEKMKKSTVKKEKKHEASETKAYEKKEEKKERKEKKK